MIREKEEILKDIEYLVENDLIENIGNIYYLFSFDQDNYRLGTTSLYKEINDIMAISKICNYLKLKFLINIMEEEKDKDFSNNYNYVFIKELSEGFFQNITNKDIKEVYEEKKDLFIFMYNIILDKKFRSILDEYNQQKYKGISSCLYNAFTNLFKFFSTDFDNQCYDMLYHIKSSNYINNKLKDEKYIYLFLNIYKMYYSKYPINEKNFDIVYELFQLIKKDIVKLVESKTYDILNIFINNEEDFYNFMNVFYSILPIEKNGKVDLIKIIKKLLKKKNLSIDLIYNFLNTEFNLLSDNLINYFIYNSLDGKQKEADDCLNFYIQKKFEIENKSINEVNFWKDKVFNFKLSPGSDIKVAWFGDNSIINEIFIFNHGIDSEKINHVIFEYIINTWNENHKDLNKIKLIFKYFKNIISNVNSYENKNNYDFSKFINKGYQRKFYHPNETLSSCKNFILNFYHYVMDNYQDKIKKSLLKQFFLLS